ncbi:hypothetical protein JTE90_018693 [Oedothorax gibbosus]|uniref:Uncharacterized protein n=1 Tax=Oedothorax gibbosus TaxID=931172 RepID=A0AAV6UZL8_9ARAC|nr:hypothetical protein JTE90_018693 [Oedothorax gibbosus]
MISSSLSIPERMESNQKEMLMNLYMISLLVFFNSSTIPTLNYWRSPPSHPSSPNAKRRPPMSNDGQSRGIHYIASERD